MFSIRNGENTLSTSVPLIKLYIELKLSLIELSCLGGDPQQKYIWVQSGL